MTEPSEEMVEAGARALACGYLVSGTELAPTGLPMWIARRVLAAADAVDTPASGRRPVATMGG